jgi:beta-phosphoglucomutase-like phosphatase (HAD superfamily)
MKKAHVKPCESLVIEDSFVGLEAAMGANVNILGMATTINNYKDIMFVKDYVDLKARFNELFC